MRSARDRRPSDSGFGRRLTSIVRTELFGSIYSRLGPELQGEQIGHPSLNPAGRGSVISSKNADRRETKLL